MNTVKLVFWIAVAYLALLVVIRGAFPQETSQTVPLLGVPLLVVVFIISRELSHRSTGPTSTPAALSQSSIREDPVQFLSGQIGVAAAASDSYFDAVVRARLKELLIEKVSLETGIDTGSIKRSLSDPEEAQQLLHDEELYHALLGPVPNTGVNKMNMIDKAIDLIEDWKG